MSGDFKVCSPKVFRGVLRLISVMISTKLENFRVLLSCSSHFQFDLAEPRNRCTNAQSCFRSGRHTIPRFFTRAQNPPFPLQRFPFELAQRCSLDLLRVLEFGSRGECVLLYLRAFQMSNCLLRRVLRSTSFLTFSAPIAYRSKPLIAQFESVVIFVTRE